MHEKNMGTYKKKAKTEIVLALRKLISMSTKKNFFYVALWVLFYFE